MHYLVDPDLVRVGPVSWAFVIGLGILLPALAIRQHRALVSGELPMPSRLDIYANAIVTHFILVLAVWAVVWTSAIDLMPPYRLDTFGVVVGLVALGAGLPLLSEHLGTPDALARERTRLLAPRSRRDYALFYLMSFTAGVSEQFAYRGALFVLLSALTRHWWIAALLSALAFGVVHVFQGWRNAGIITVIALRDQIVVGLTGSLVIAIIIHTIHDMIAGTVLGMRVRREENALAVP